MIPKIIHYCWFGRGEKPELAKKCIASWKKFCPDFEIREWNEDNCDYLAMPFMAEAYAAKKYAFVSDVMRLIVLEQYGGSRLLTGHVRRTAREIQLPHAHADGAGGHQNDLMPRIFQIAQHPAQPLHPLDVQPPRGVRQRGGPHFYNDTHTAAPFRPLRACVFAHYISSTCKMQETLLQDHKKYVLHSAVKSGMMNEVRVV